MPRFDYEARPVIPLLVLAVGAGGPRSRRNSALGTADVHPAEWVTAGISGSRHRSERLSPGSGDFAGQDLGDR